ncbi:MAG: BamA/TamA family outer membrane protein, partial [Candidatus Krumholzibacteriia bacterium]
MRITCFFALTALLLGVRTLKAQPVPDVSAYDGMRIGAIQTLGLGEVSPKRVHRQLGLSPEGAFDSGAVRRGRRQLRSAGWIRNVEAHPRLVAPDSLVVIVLVQRATPAELRPLLRRRPDDRLVLGVKLNAWGRSGRGEHFELRLAGVGQELLQVEWWEPRPILRLPLGLGFHAGVAQEIEEAESDIEFDRVVLGGALVLPLGGPRLEVSGSVWQVAASDSAGLVAAGSVDHLRRGRIALAWGRAPQVFAWSYFVGTIGVGATSGAAESQDFEARLQASGSIGSRCVVAAGFSYRDARGTVPRYTRRHLGGGPTLRAHPYGVANGDGATWGGVELRVPVNFRTPESFTWTPMPLELHLFADFGMAWRASAPGATSEATRRSLARMRWSAGVGCGAFMRGTLPLRID